MRLSVRIHRFPCSRGLEWRAPSKEDEDMGLCIRPATIVQATLADCLSVLCQRVEGFWKGQDRQESLAADMAALQAAMERRAL